MVVEEKRKVSCDVCFLLSWHFSAALVWLAFWVGINMDIPMIIVSK